jgi:hypothetical protein
MPCEAMKRNVTRSRRRAHHSGARALRHLPAPHSGIAPPTAVGRATYPECSQ